MHFTLAEIPSNRKIDPPIHLPCRRGEMADSRDLKSLIPKGVCGFESRRRHSFRLPVVLTKSFLVGF